MYSGNSTFHAANLTLPHSTLRITASDRSANGAIAETLNFDGTGKILTRVCREHQLVSDMEVVVVGYLSLKGNVYSFIP